MTLRLLQDTIQSLEAQIEQARRKAFSSAFTPSWFVLFKSQSAAMMAASTRIYAHDNTKFQVRACGACCACGC
jgi:hypothetical protein